MLSKELKEFIRQNSEGELDKIILSSGKYPGIDTKLAATIIDARRRLRTKVPDWADNVDLIFINSTSIEQCSSDITAIHKQKFSSGGIVADLTGGLGVDSYYLSQNNKTLIYFERDPTLFNAVIYNFRKLNAANIIGFNTESNYDTITKNFQIALNIESNPIVDLIYIDPSRRGGGNRRVLSIRDYEPDITLMNDYLFKLAQRVLVKVSPMADIKSLIHDCKNITTVDVLSVDNECKEILFLMERGCSVDFDNVTINAFNYIRNRGVAKISFTPREERESISSFADEHQMVYLYEPNSSILKAGAFKFTGVKYNLNKIAQSTHLYSSREYIADFPGKIYIIKEIADYCKKTIRNLKKIYPKANIATRNFPLSPFDLKSLLKVEDGGNITIVGCTLNNGAKKLVICSRVL